MFSKNNFITVSLLLAGTVILSGCSFGNNARTTAPTSSEPATQTSQTDYSYSDSQAVLNSATSNRPTETSKLATVSNAQIITATEQDSLNSNESDKGSLQYLNTCIKELNALKSLSPTDYNRLVGSFKEVSEINQLYKQVASTASPDTIELLQMAIESKTKVLCAKVRYNSVLSTESTLEKISGL
ncbi:hypothetical protein [Providencia burhodogranariea]|uniref:Lipoprotein n=1 Tax=Providencia burhodogranariea DSM 19968 TaxID=1141662 RepID=K8X590_9GAMM|nr:hypothetical protein OOA_01782 [Providencia burhodogranariea DSM 19968]